MRKYISIHFMAVDFENGNREKRRFPGMDEWFFSWIVSFVPILAFNIRAACINHASLGNGIGMIFVDYEIYFILVTMLISAIYNLYKMKHRNTARNFLFATQLILVIAYSFAYVFLRNIGTPSYQLIPLTIVSWIIVLLCGILSYYNKRG